MSSQPPTGGIFHRNVPPKSSHLRLKATFPVSQGWLLIAGSTVPGFNRILKKKLVQKKKINSQVGHFDYQWKAENLIRSSPY